ncbi:MAG: aminopeptidase P family protein [Rhodobacteraceae bacterium]|nr:aminopeptidase P family protein [Paracoccaceae bacterium]
MFQNFDVITRPGDGPPRLAALRKAIADENLAGFLVPRADAHQGEYVADCDARLAWLTGFTGSAGFCAVLPDIAGIFVDGRYRLQVRAQVDKSAFTPVNWPDTRLSDWLKEHAPKGAAIGFDPWLHTIDEIEKLRKVLTGTEITLVECAANLVDAVWTDRPDPPKGKAVAQPEALAGRSAMDKRKDIASTLCAAGEAAAVITLPDSIAWLLNIRGSDIPRVPIMQGFAVIQDDASVDLFADPEKLDGLEDHLGATVRIWPAEEFDPFMRQLTGKVRVDRQSAPMAVQLALNAALVEPIYGRDPCILPKACKSAAEIAGAEAAHLRDGAAMVEFLAWLASEAAKLKDDPKYRLTEIGIVEALESFRRATNKLRDISFDTICGAGPDAAIVHYRVTRDSDRAVKPDEFLLVDSGGQYEDGTTDITRTIAIGDPGEAARAAFTRVLQGMIAISRARFPKGVAGRDLDALARYALWCAGQDYDHGTGHGVGAYLSVHEGPQRLARTGTEPLAAGMILSNEPGHYCEGEYGIRIENLIVVEPAPALPGADARDMLAFRTLTYVPIDRNGMIVEMLSAGERAWIDEYHAETWRRLSPLVSEPARDWLKQATSAL